MKLKIKTMGNKNNTKKENETISIPKKEYERLILAMRGIARSVSVHPDCQPDSEFMDMVKRCEDALDDVGEGTSNKLNPETKD